MGESPENTDSAVQTAAQRGNEASAGPTAGEGECSLVCKALQKETQQLHPGH